MAIAHFQLKIQSVPALIITWSLILKSSDLIGWNITSFRLEKLKARDLMYNSATTDECVERRKMLQQQQQENGRWFSRVFAWSRVLCGHLHIGQKSLIIIQKTLSHWRIINKLHHSAPLLWPNVSSPFFEVWQFVTSLFSALIGCSCNFQPMRGRFITNHVPYKRQYT